MIGLDCGIIERISFFSKTKEKIDDLCRNSCRWNWHTKGIRNLTKQFLELGDWPILIHTIEKFVLEPSIENIVVGVHGDWVSHAEDLVDKYLPLHKERIIITKGGLTAIQVLRKSLKPLMLIVRLLQRISLLPTILFVHLLRFAWFRTISNLLKIMTQW